VTLYLIRHAQAGQGNPADPDDHLRPLSPKGREQAAILKRACVRLELRFDRLFSSPYTRARETAEALKSRCKGGRLETLDELPSDAYEDLLTALERTLHPNDTHIALVGHEPYLSELASLLLSGKVGDCTLRFRKGMLAELAGALRPGGLELQSALTPRQLKALLG
jgi:phosphohistidine phosphatase